MNIALLCEALAATAETYGRKPFPTDQERAFERFAMELRMQLIAADDRAIRADWADRHQPPHPIDPSHDK